MPVSATLDDLAGFLRGIWLECCGHMSASSVGPQDDYDNVDPFPEATELTQPPLSKLGLELGQKFGYTYDFGSSTELSVLLQALEWVGGKASKSLRRLARNIPPERHCSECGASAKRVRSGDYWPPEHLENQQRRAFLASAPDQQVRERRFAFERFLDAEPWKLEVYGLGALPRLDQPRQTRPG